MSRSLSLALLLCASALSETAFADPTLASAVLPTSRATETGNTVTAFATIINAGPSDGVGCGISIDSELPVDFDYQTTNSADNAVTGSPNTPVDLAVGAAQSFVMSFTMTGTFASAEVQPTFACSNGAPAAVLSGVNTLLLTSAASGIPDVIALAATPGNTGYAQIEGVDGTGIFSVATSNVGAAGELTVTADSGVGGPGVNLLLCETNPATGACTNPVVPAASVTTNADAGGTQTFAVFVQGNGLQVADNPAISRAYVRFASGGVTSGLTSVALRTVEVSTQPAADIQVWANNGGDKVVREEIRSYSGGDILSSVWDGTTIRTFGARNEVVAFNVVVDNNDGNLPQVSVEFSRLTNGEFTLETTETSADSLFDWTSRPIEVFSVGYLKIHGLSRIAYELYDETHIPEELRRPFESFQPAAPAIGNGVWEDRQNHDKSYPDIAEPIEVRGSASIASGQSQSFWVDVYLPKNTPPGTLSGVLNVKVGNSVQQAIPVEIEVVNLTLPDERESKTMVHMAGEQIAERYFLGAAGGVIPNEDDARYREIVDNHFKLAWRHGLSITDLNELVPDKVLPANQPNVDWEVRLTGGLYTAANGYAGPGQGLAHDVFSIGSYGNWSTWWGLRRFDPEATDVFDPEAPLAELRSELESRTDQWETWFQTNAPDTDRYLYVDDEPSVSFINSGPRLPIEFANLVSQYVAENPGPGGNLDTFVTASPLDYDTELPNTTILGTVISEGQTDLWDVAIAALNADPDRRYFMYNGRRPASGTFATDDDGVALRELSWGQYKKGISRWYYWNSNYWNNFLGGPAVRDLSEVDPEGDQYRSGTRTNVFKSAHTFGSHDFFDSVIGETGVFNYSNGDGVLMYPGTDLVFPAESRGLDGPIASLRMKHWRRGVQDVQYLSLATAVDPVATQAIIDGMVPEVMWELGVADENDPTYVHKPPSWSTDPDDWERARAELINLILGSEVIDLDRF